MARKIEAGVMYTTKAGERVMAVDFCPAPIGWPKDCTYTCRLGGWNYYVDGEYAGKFVSPNRNNGTEDTAHLGEKARWDYYDLVEFETPEVVQAKQLELFD